MIFLVSNAKKLKSNIRAIATYMNPSYLVILVAKRFSAGATNTIIMVSFRGLYVILRILLYCKSTLSVLSLINIVFKIRKRKSKLISSFEDS